jgi:hypothetical protein
MPTTSSHSKPAVKPTLCRVAARSNHHSLGAHESDATPASYIDHAIEINRIARILLPMDLPIKERKVNGLTAKISLGLSLQAGELAGKAMLRSLGYSTIEIKKEHSYHNLPGLLACVQENVTEKWPNGAPGLDDFLCFQPVIDGIEGNTIGAYLNKHFSKGAAAQPRSYFYPDEPKFFGPQPYYALVIIVEHLIHVAKQLEIAVCATG